MGRAARFYKVGQPLKVEEISLPRLTNNEVLLKVRAASICHSDVHAIDGIYHMPTPVVLGHEVAGEVQEVGNNVHEFKSGDRAVIHFLTPCGHCHKCSEGKTTICTNINSTPMYGWYDNGGYAEYIKVDASRLVGIPSNLPCEFAASLGCAGITAFHAVRSIAQVKIGDTVAVYGVGGVGMYVLQIAKLSGANTIAIGRSEEKLRVAQRYLGVDSTINICKEDLRREISHLTHDDGADIIFDLVVNSESVDNSMHIISNSGKLVLLGIGSQPVYLNPKALTMREISVLGSMAGTKNELESVVELAGKGKLKGIANTRYGLEEINEALSDLKAGKIIGRAYIDPSN